MNNDVSIPQQHTGVSSNTSKTIRLSDDKQAQLVFNKASENLLAVNKWHNLAGTGTADFQITDISGNAVNKAAAPGDFLRINIPGPSNNNDGYDWVMVEAVDSQTTHNFHCWTIIRVRPSASPMDKSDNTKHFFSDEATSNFMVERKGQVVTAAVLGRNEKANNESQGILNAMRNTVVAVSAMLGLSKPQWKSLVDGILEDACEQVNAEQA